MPKLKSGKGEMYCIWSTVHYLVFEVEVRSKKMLAKNVHYSGVDYLVLYTIWGGGVTILPGPRATGLIQSTFHFIVCINFIVFMERIFNSTLTLF